ncbi:hypothetical protein KM043_014549 [Ampulex compressa]|nr:hypothetical protein KM043_014549 [Ampulex compressa]
MSPCTRNPRLPRSVPSYARDLVLAKKNREKEERAAVAERLLVSSIPDIDGSIERVDPKVSSVYAVPSLDLNHFVPTRFRLEVSQTVPREICTPTYRCAFTCIAANLSTGRRTDAIPRKTIFDFERATIRTTGKEPEKKSLEKSLHGPWNGLDSSIANTGTRFRVGPASWEHNAGSFSAQEGREGGINES